MNRTFPGRILRRDQLTKNTPLDAAMTSFFTANYEIAAKTKEFYETAFAAFNKFVREDVGREPTLADLNKDYVDAHLAKLSKRPTRKYPNGSPFVTRGAATSLKRLANWLAQDGILADAHGNSLLKHVKKPRVANDVRQPLDREELEAVKAGAGRSGQRDYALIVLMAGSGLRLNEARELRVGDISIKDRQLTVRAETSKFRKSRIVDFHDAVARELDRFMRVRPVLRDQDALFQSDEGTGFTSDGFEKIFRRIRNRSGLNRFSAHLLRHTWATNFMRQPGADLLALKRLGGWATWEQVERYSHAIPMKDRAMLPNPVDTGSPQRAAITVLRTSKLAS